MEVVETNECFSVSIYGMWEEVHTYQFKCEKHDKRQVCIVYNTVSLNDWNIVLLEFPKFIIYRCE